MSLELLLGILMVIAGCIVATLAIVHLVTTTQPSTSTTQPSTSTTQPSTSLSAWYQPTLEHWPRPDLLPPIHDWSSLPSPEYSIMTTRNEPVGSWETAGTLIVDPTASLTDNAVLPLQVRRRGIHSGYYDYQTRREGYVVELATMTEWWSHDQTVTNSSLGPYEWTVKLYEGYR